MSLYPFKFPNKACLVSTALCSIVFLVFFYSSPVVAQPNYYETLEIKKKILKDFKELIDIWSEELYFEMYQFGTTRSRRRIKKIEFVQRLVDLHWKPSLKPIMDEEIKILYRNFAIIEFTQEFVNKFDQTRMVKKRMIFPTIMEGTSWKIDLTKLINIPYEGKIAEEKPAKKETKPVDATSDSTANTPPEAQP